MTVCPTKGGRLYWHKGRKWKHYLAFKKSKVPSKVAVALLAWPPVTHSAYSNINLKRCFSRIRIYDRCCVMVYMVKRNYGCVSISCIRPSRRAELPGVWKIRNVSNRERPCLAQTFLACARETISGFRSTAAAALFYPNLRSVPWGLKKVVVILCKLFNVDDIFHLKGSEVAFYRD